MRQDDRPLCACCGQPAYWQIDKRLRAGGWWECAVKRRGRQRDLYANDPFYRIEKRLHDDARERRQRIERRKELIRSGQV